MNRVQALGHSKDIENLEPLDEKLKSWSWNAVYVDGHDFDAIEKAFANIPENGKPTMLIFRTIKARGVSWLEDTVKSHYGFIPDDKIEQAIAECRAFCEKTKKGE